MPVPIVNPKVSDIATEVGLSGTFSFGDLVSMSDFDLFLPEYLNGAINISQINSLGQYRGYGTCLKFETPIISNVSRVWLGTNGNGWEYTFTFSNHPQCTIGRDDISIDLVNWPGTPGFTGGGADPGCIFIARSGISDPYIQLQFAYYNNTVEICSTGAEQGKILTVTEYN